MKRVFPTSDLLLLGFAWSEMVPGAPVRLPISGRKWKRFVTVTSSTVQVED